MFPLLFLSLGKTISSSNPLLFIILYFPLYSLTAVETIYIPSPVPIISPVFLSILSASLKPECQEQSKELSKLLEKTSISWQALCQIAKEQALSLLLYDYILTYSFEILTKEEQKKIQNPIFGKEFL